MTFALPPRLSDRDARVLAAFLDELATAATTGAIDHSTVDAMTRALHLRGDASVSVEPHRVAESIRPTRTDGFPDGPVSETT
jgi:hypothetical protein